MNSVFCSSCFHDIKKGVRTLEVCGPHHEFYYTGPELKDCDRVEKDMVRVGEDTISIKSWITDLKRKWDLL